VSLTPRGGGGTLQIAYGSLEQLDALIARLSWEAADGRSAESAVGSDG
jgi:hypothetical protein